jgi:hypothetical protein
VELVATSSGGNDDQAVDDVADDDVDLVGESAYVRRVLGKTYGLREACAILFSTSDASLVVAPNYSLRLVGLETKLYIIGGFLPNKVPMTNTDYNLQYLKESGQAGGVAILDLVKRTWSYPECTFDKASKYRRFVCWKFHVCKHSRL